MRHESSLILMVHLIHYRSFDGICSSNPSDYPCEPLTPRFPPKVVDQRNFAAVCSAAHQVKGVQNEPFFTVPDDPKTACTRSAGPPKRATEELAGSPSWDRRRRWQLRPQKTLNCNVLNHPCMNTSTIIYHMYDNVCIRWCCGIPLYC